MPHQFTVRSSVLEGFVGLADHAGLNARELVAAAGLPRDCLDDAELRLPSERLAVLIESFAERTGMTDVGLRLASGHSLLTGGRMVLALLDEAQTLRDFIVGLSRHMHLHDGSMVLALEGGDPGVLQVDWLSGVPIPKRQAMEHSLGLLVRGFRQLLGGQWAPLSVSFRHSRPADVQRHREIFGCRVRFGAELDSISLRRADLDAPLRHQLPAPLPADASLVARARAEVCRLLPSRTCSAAVVAAQLGVERSTLHRHLAAAGLNFRLLVEQVRREQLAHLLSDPARPLAVIAHDLGFVSASGFARWHSRWFGHSASAHRRARRR